MSRKTGHNKATEPIRYVAEEPILQNAILATIGPNALARAPSDLNIPIKDPFWCSNPYCDAIVIIQGTTIAVAKSFNVLLTSFSL